MAEDALLNSVYETLVKNVESKKRSYHLSTYKDCFIGSEAVDYMVKQGVTSTREEAVELGKAMESEGLLYHVTRDHPFADSPYFYRFRSLDVFRGENEGETWDTVTVDTASLIDAVPLESEITERDADVAVTPLDEHNKKLLNLVKPRNWKNPEEKHVTLLVIGAGAGGLISAIQGAGLGIKTAIVEKHLLGGDCLNVGCVPSKALIRCARAIREVKNCHEMGVELEGKFTVNFGDIMARMRKLRSEIAPNDSAKRYSSLGVHVYQGTAKFIDKTTVEITSPSKAVSTLKFSKCIVATGGRAFIPPIPGLQTVNYLTNASLFNLTELPKVFGVLGSGPIGTEMAQAFACFGSEVYVFDMQDKILPREDQDAAEIIQKNMEQDGVKFVLNSNIERVESRPDGRICVYYKTKGEGEGKELVMDQLLISAGRAPNVEGLGLEQAGVQFGNRGIKVKDGLQTTNQNIYAVGDVCLSYQFTHMADASAKIAFINAMFPFTNAKTSKLVVPWCTYTTPEIAHVGAYESQLAKKNVLFDVFKVKLEDNDRAILEGAPSADGFVKLIVKRGSDQILGATIVAENAGDMISEITVCMTQNVGAKALSGVIHPYPTTADALRICAGNVNKTRLTPGVKKLLKNVVSLKTSLA